MKGGVMAYRELSIEIEQRILRDRALGWLNPWRAQGEPVRRNQIRDQATLLRPAFVDAPAGPAVIKKSEKSRHLYCSFTEIVL